MKFMKSRRTVLIVTVLLAAMLSVVGGTFAWFTDTVESTSNEIKSGTLDLELYQMAEDGQWQNVADLTEPMFSYDLWEPGYTMWKALKVENKGTLALKWKAMFEIEGEMSKLAEVIDVYAREGSAKPERSEIPANAQDTSPTNPSSQWWYDGTLKDFIENSETNTYGSLKAGESKELTLVLKMREEAGNEYQNLTLGAFDLKIVATQDTVEKDSFDDQYDADALYPGEAVTVKVRNNDEFWNAVEAVTNVPTIIEGVVTDGQRTKVTISGNNYVQSGITVRNIDFTGDGTCRMIVKQQNTEETTVTYENCTFAEPAFNNMMFLNGVNGQGGKQVFTVCSFTGQIQFDQTALPENETVIDECVFDGNNSFGYVICLGGNSTFNNCTFDYSKPTFGNLGANNNRAINVYSDNKYNTHVTLNGCTLVNTTTYCNTGNSTLTINP